MQVAVLRVGIASEVALFEHGNDVILQFVILDFGLSGCFVKQALAGGEVIEVLTACRVVLDDTIRKAQREVGIAVVRCFLVALQNGLGQQVLVVVDGLAVTVNTVVNGSLEIADALVIAEHRVAVEQGAVSYHFIEATDIGHYCF